MKKQILKVAAVAAVAAGSAVSFGEVAKHLALPVTDSEASRLSGVEGTAKEDIFAVGSELVKVGERRLLQPVMMYFDGAEWARIAVETESASALNDVASVDFERAFAVGQTYEQGAYQTLVMASDSFTAKRIKSPQAPGGSAFHAISHTDSSDFVMVGSATDDAQYPMFATYNGKEFKVRYGPASGSKQNVLLDVYAFTGQDAFAVGLSSNADGKTSVLVQQMSDGEVFDISPLSPGRKDALYGVFAAAKDDVWAVGEYFDEQRQISRPLVMRYDGRDWKKIDVIDGPGQFEAIEVGPDGAIYIAGSRIENGTHPVVVRFTGRDFEKFEIEAPNDREQLADLGWAGSHLLAVGHGVEDGKMRPVAFHVTVSE